MDQQLGGAVHFGRFLSCFAFAVCACLFAFCFLLLSLSFLPPLSPIVNFLPSESHQSSKSALSPIVSARLCDVQSSQSISSPFRNWADLDTAGRVAVRPPSATVTSLSQECQNSSSRRGRHDHGQRQPEQISRDSSCTGYGSSNLTTLARRWSEPSELQPIRPENSHGFLTIGNPCRETIVRVHLLGECSVRSR